MIDSNLPDTPTSAVGSGPATTVVVAATTDEIVLSVRGRLDGPGGSLLLEALEAAIAAEPLHRIAVDLTAVVSTTSEGIRVVAECSGLAAHHRGGLRFLAGGPPAAA